MNKQSKEQFVHQVFESIADKYDMMNTLLSFRRHKAWRKFAMKKLNVQPGQSAIDVCCGTGDWAIALAEKTGREGRVVGLDFSKNMLEIAEQKKSEKQYDHLELVHGNAMSLPYEDHTFDYATIGFALRNVPDIHQVLTEMTRVVKPGGVVASLELSKPVWPGFKQLYYLYFNRLLPFLGKVFANRYEQYSWLPESLKHFPDSQELGRMFETAGLEKVEIYLLTGGVAALHIGYKPRL
ncbi:Ubiquinone/menaquinone biosynthesis methyltransferase ubiE [Caldalkalibacillus thermarum TA2.A1]|uniref:Demethylmenaquinone methyltransferase n=1 Tax=Caldalkalibacillus thermarum (strain TA2.A1) TaxID=986075 RepID=F5L722_CALTT|nr:demethylmenaquinone methyltransferase [Caldalkalibacillus thermarum]EGL82857.1 Ubiquinone/menaquinone biosynthesis methyltransferase ubiE [Caldalkalibacillus thermarum TA2.A1]QZT32711.1 demethylmenaquinone methyltransferase [Caldalkalibacillus thermarum TA2.A1]